jgi:nitrogen fixation/metabolism regulation signal transduction histidine kinase
MKSGTRSIRTRILAAFVLALLSFGGTVAYGWSQLRAIGAELDAVNAGFLPMSKAGVELTSLVVQLDRDHDRFARRGPQSAIARRSNAGLYRQSIHDAVNRGRKAATAARTRLTHSEDLATLARIESVFDELEVQTSAYEKAVDTPLLDASDDEAQRAETLADLDRQRQVLAAGASLVQALVDGQIAQVSRRAATAQNQALAITGSLGTLALLLATALAGLALVSLRPIGQLMEQVQRVAAGDLTGRIELGTRDEMGQLANEFNVMAEAVAERDRTLNERAEMLDGLQARLRQVLDTITSGLVVMENNAVAVANPAAAELWGLAPGDPLPEWMHGLTHGHQDDLAVGPQRFDLVCVPFGNTGTLLVGEDVTERNAVRDRLMRSERLAVVGRMLAQITHEVRNPLNAMSLNAELLNDEVEGKEATAMLETITEEIRRLETLTGRYLHLSRPRVPQMSTVDPEHLITELLRAEGPALEQMGVKVELQASTEGPTTLDADAVSRAVRNLVRNAAEAGATHVDLRLICTDTRLSMTVTDNGPGLSEEQLEQAFDPFFTTKARGTGLGLAISRQELEEISGNLEFDSEYSDGARFKLTVPLDPESTS